MPIMSPLALELKVAYLVVITIIIQYLQVSSNHENLVRLIIECIYVVFPKISILSSDPVIAVFDDQWSMIIQYFSVNARH